MHRRLLGGRPGRRETASPSSSRAGGIIGRRQPAPAAAGVGWCAGRRAGGRDQPGGWIAQARAVGLAAWLSLCSSTPPAHPAPRSPRRGGPARPALHPTGPDGQLAVVEGHKHRGKTRAGWPTGALTGSLDRALSDRLGVRAGIPRPCRWKALRSDGHLAPSSAAAAFTEPRRSASAKVRSASARSVRKRPAASPAGDLLRIHRPPAPSRASRFPERQIGVWCSEPGGGCPWTPGMLRDTRSEPFCNTSPFLPPARPLRSVRYVKRCPTSN
jgi:hypothetical protein